MRNSTGHWRLDSGPWHSPRDSINKLGAGCVQSRGFPLHATELVRTTLGILCVGEGIEHGDGSRQHFQADEQVLEVAAILPGAERTSADQDGNHDTLQPTPALA